MDWLDAVLISITFSLTIVLSSFVPSLTTWAPNLAVIGVIAAPTLRRTFFGAPSLPEPKSGVLWRFISIIGLFTIFVSVAIFYGGAGAIVQSQEPIPDFQTEVEKEFAEIDEHLKEANAFLDGVVVKKGTPQEEIDKMIAEKKEQRKQEQNEKMMREIEHRMSEFQKDKKRRRTEGFNALGLGFVVCLLGGGLLRLRYPWNAPPQE